jgi:uncharacterized lipoprotein YbaY/heat shock protein HslJ/uncharacterized lipoprotein NlpE involved in copper resistance
MQRESVMPRLFTLCLVGLGFLSGMSHADTVTGTATYRERIVLTPGAVFEAVLEDVSRADAAAVELGRVTRPDPGNPPFAFDIPYDPASIDPVHTYAVRARVTGPNGLMFVSDTMTPVLTRGAPDRAEIIMVRTGGHAGAPLNETPRIGAHGLWLPASFTGTLPCADCEGIRHHLDLWPDQTFHLSREWLGRETPLREDTLGRWSADAARGALVLQGAGDTPMQWQITGPDSLRALALDGSEIVSDLPYDLISDGTLTPVDLTVAMSGEFVYFADAAIFEECLTGRTYPVAMEGDYLALERAYLAARVAPQAPVLAVIDGQITTRPNMEGPPRRTIVVDRLVQVLPGETCERNRAQADLVNTYWRLDRLGDRDVAGEPGTREPHIVLRAPEPGDTEARFSATVGCNQMMGSVSTGPESIAFGQIASTMMACPPPLDQLEFGLARALEGATNYRIIGQTLILNDDAGGMVAVFRAVYLP